MKKLIALLLILMLPAAALAFDTEELYRTKNCDVYEEQDTFNTVVRLVNQPYMGVVDEGEMVVFIDYVTLVDTDLTLPRVVVSLSIYDMMQAETIAFTVNGKTYAFSPECIGFEYDGIYMEDYTFCLAEEGLPFLKALAQQKKDAPIPVAFISDGVTLLSGEVVLPGGDAAFLYDRYIDLGGKKQDLAPIRDLWPCVIESAK